VLEADVAILIVECGWPSVGVTLGLANVVSVATAIIGALGVDVGGVTDPCNLDELERVSW
jgi:hypothetical protein